MLIKKNKIMDGVIVDTTKAENSYIKVVAGVDAGSTETRVCMVDADDAAYMVDELHINEAISVLRDVHTIPSTFAIVGSEREIVPTTPMLHDCYDSRIILLHSKAEKPYIGRERVVRAQKLKDAGNLSSMYLDSTTDKTSNKVFYINVIDALGYTILEKYNGNLPTHVEVALSLSVRPKELSSIYRKRMQDNLIGTYSFVWKDVNIEIEITSLDLSTEPEAQIDGTTMMHELISMSNAAEDVVDESNRISEKLSGVSNYIHIEGGGSSIGVEVVKDGSIIASCSTTFPIGGNYLMRSVRDSIREALGKMPAEQATYEAINTGFLRNGRGEIDVLDIVKDCKKQLAESIFERFKHEVLDVQNLITMSDIEVITMSGRLFSYGECDVSIVTYFEECIHSDSPETEVLLLHDNFIPQGNVAAALSESNPFEGVTYEETAQPTVDAVEEVVVEGGEQ